MTLLAITVLGHDQPGIIARTTATLAASGMNLEDSSMTLLRGHFAMTLICAGTARAGDLEAALAPLTGAGLMVSVREVADEPGPEMVGAAHLLTVHGADRLGIVTRLTEVVAEAGGNITDLTTRLSGELYVLVAEVDLPESSDADELQAAIAATAAELGVDAHLRPLERDEL